jgi:hypothetical protein
MSRKSLSAKLLLAMFFIVTAVSSANAETNPYGGIAVPPPGANEVIFTVVNGSKNSSYSMKQLKALSSRTITINEPFVKKVQTFTVIPLSVFTKENNIRAKSTIRTIALNDYVYANKVRRFLKADAMIAIARDGKPIPYDQGGPIRIVFANSSVWAKNLDAWNWSLRSIAVK